MKRKTQFNIIASIILIVSIASWFCVQRYAFGPVEENVLGAVLNVLGHAVIMWTVLKFVAKRFK
jgi:hypothetical protein